MIDWLDSMQQTFEFYKVDPGTWLDKCRINTIEKCEITRDSELDTKQYATITCAENLEECYIRPYLIVIQNRVRYKIPFGTFLVQTPKDGFDGKKHTNTLDAYSPLLELKEDSPPIGYTIMKGTPILSSAASVLEGRIRAPIISTNGAKTLYKNFVANSDDSWLNYLSDLLIQDNYSVDLDELGRIIFVPYQDLRSMQPVVTFNDGNSSILDSDIELERDLYGIPNIIEVIYSSNTEFLFSEVVNDDPNSITSTVNRGRRILYRETNPGLSGVPNQKQLDEYARQLLRKKSSLEYKISYKHGYYPVRVGDCVRLDYRRAGMMDIKAKITRQTILCEPGCPVSETAVYTTDLWG